MPSQASVRRYVRRHVNKAPFSIFVSCLPGTEDDTAAELQYLLPRQRPIFEKGGLLLEGTIADAYRLNLGLSTAHRVLLRLSTFAAWSFPMLMDHASRIFWPAFIPDSRAVDVRVSATESRLNMRKRIAETVQTAIGSSFKGFEGTSHGTHASVHVRIRHDRASISLDTSGDHLHKRGDKPFTDIAPIRSTLASIPIRRSIEDASMIVCDPFCGSGTILLEAVRRGGGVAPGQNRGFAFMSQPYFNPGAWRQVMRDDSNMRQPLENVAIIGGDVRQAAIDATTKNLRNLCPKARHTTKLAVQDFHETVAQAVGEHNWGAIITNPPYGVRVGNEAGARDVQTQLADCLARLPSGWTFAVFTPLPELFTSAAGLEVERHERFQAGGLNISLVSGRPRSR